MSAERLHAILRAIHPADEAAIEAKGSQIAAVDAPPSVHDLEEMIARFHQAPSAVTGALGDAIGREFSDAQVLAMLEEARDYLGDPTMAVGLLERLKFWDRSKPQLPDDFESRYIAERFRGSGIQIDPYDRRFEDDSIVGILGWILYNGRLAIFPSEKAQFRRHGDNRFIYPIRNPDGGSGVTVALFSDYGTGLAHSEFIAHQLFVDAHPYAIHLGDIYYVGSISETWRNFERPLRRMLNQQQTELFLLADNHEGYSGFHGYLGYIDRQRANGPHRQEGSYFCLRNDEFQIVAPDTIWNGRGRLQDPGLHAWVSRLLREGRESGRVNVLLTSYHPYDHGRTGRNKLLDEDLRALLDGDFVDLWFWGNVHYCALWNRGPSVPFIGSCIGHGGYPYGRQEKKSRQPAPQLWLEEGSRYGDTGVRPDRGNNGYCLLDLRAGHSVSIRYVDWRGNLVREFRLARRPGERFLSIAA